MNATSQLKPSPRPEVASTPCRFCGTVLRHSFVDLGVQPPANYYVRPEDAGNAERFYPLHAYVCESCLLVQLEAFQTPDQLFGDYAYFSSYSESWVRHAERYAEAMIPRLGLGADSRLGEGDVLRRDRVIEVIDAPLGRGAGAAQRRGHDGDRGDRQQQPPKPPARAVRSAGGARVRRLAAMRRRDPRPAFPCSQGGASLPMARVSGLLATI